MLNLLGLALLPAFGAGAVMLGWSLYRSSRQKLMVTHDQVWFKPAALLSAPVNCRRADIERVVIRQSWIQKQLGTGDLVVHCGNLDKPLVVRGLSDFRSIKRRLERHIVRRRQPSTIQHRPEPMLPVPVGTARLAPRMRPQQLAA